MTKQHLQFKVKTALKAGAECQYYDKAYRDGYNAGYQEGRDQGYRKDWSWYDAHPDARKPSFNF